MHLVRSPSPLLVFAASLALTACPKGEDSELSDDLLGIGVSPNNPIMQVNQTVAFEAKAFYADYTNEVITGQVDWVSTDERVATITASGLATALTEGSADIIATYTDGMSARVELTVSGADVSGVSISPSSVDVEVGHRVQLVANATFSDGTTGNIAGSCDWTSTDAGIAQVDGSGLVTGQGVGTAQISASYQGMSINPANVNVVAEGTDLPEPDLDIRNIQASVVGDEISYLFTVKNNGAGYAGEFYVDLFLDPGGSPGTSAVADAWGWVPGLAGGETTEVWVDMYGVDAGSYSSYGWADKDGWVDESDETNNKHGPVEVSVSSGSSGYPNLAITTFDGVSDGYYTIYEIVITNTGGADSGPFYIDLFLDRYDSPSVYEDGDLWGEMDNLAPGESVTFEPEIDWGPYHHGYSYWDSWIFADSYDEVYESNENDNIGYVQVWAY
jgi:hypothetical protein